ncbi:MAG: sugar phosphate isomerase/epimerase [Clostridia bacterium]|nr:sugar phosphate isomerase/epimerase [Clostridia bacterium]
METGIMLYIGCKVDVYEQIRTLKEIGISRTFINAKYPELDRVLAAIREAGIVCDTLHAEYNCSDGGERFHMDDLSREGTAGDKMVARIMRNIDKCAEHHIPVIVIHPSNQAPETAINEIAKARYVALGDYAREKGVTVAFENVIYTQNLEYIMSWVPDAKFCWDCGHEWSRLKGEPPMPLFGKRLAALHIHDNFLTHDKHMIPFTGKIDFENVGKQLAESGFDGTMMLEIMYGSNEENSLEPTYRDYAIKAKQAAQRLIGIVQRYRA